VNEPLKAGDRVRWCKAWLDRMYSGIPGLLSLAGPAARRGTVMPGQHPDGAMVQWDGSVHHVCCTADMLRRCRDGE
jgi:hypothetical protein